MLGACSSTSEILILLLNNSSLFPVLVGSSVRVGGVTVESAEDLLVASSAKIH